LSQDGWEQAARERLAMIASASRHTLLGARGALRSIEIERRMKPAPTMLRRRRAARRRRASGGPVHSR
jgi:hypothetical protein